MLPCHPLRESQRFVWVSFFVVPKGLSSVLTWKLGNTLHTHAGEVWAVPEGGCSLVWKVTVPAYSVFSRQLVGHDGACDLAEPATSHAASALHSKHIPFSDMMYNILGGTSRAAVLTINYFCDLRQLHCLYLYHTVLLWDWNGKGFFVLWCVVIWPFYEMLIICTVTLIFFMKRWTCSVEVLFCTLSGAVPGTK